MRGKIILFGCLGLIAHIPPASSNSFYLNYSRTTDEISQQRWTAWRRAILRRQLDVLTWRFSPEWRAQFTFPPSQVRAFIAPVAGEGRAAEGWSLWHSTAWMHLRQTMAGSVARGDSFSGSFGLDKALNAWMTAGLNFTLTRSKAKDRSAGTWERTWQKALALHADVRLAEWLGLSVQAGPVWQRQTFQDGSAVGLVRGRRHSLGWMASGSLNAQYWLSRTVLLSAQLSVVGARDRWRAHTASGPGGTVNRPARSESLVQGVAEAGVSWWWAPAMPYVRVAYGHDLFRRNINAGTDRDDFTLTGGVSWFGAGQLAGLSLDVSGSVRLGRRHEREHTLALGVRWGW